MLYEGAQLFTKTSTKVIAICTDVLVLRSEILPPGIKYLLC